jgi:uncharacterized protein
LIADTTVISNFALAKRLDLQLEMKDIGTTEEVVLSIEDLLKFKRHEIIDIAARHGARNVRIFGSVVRGEARPESDLDLLVELEEGRSLMDHVALLQDLEDLLGCRVDVVSEKALHWYIRNRVLAEAVPL